MNCLFCDNKIVDATMMGVCISKNCEFSSSSVWYGFHIHYYVCVNKKIAIFDHGWMAEEVIKRRFFTKGTFISYNNSEHKESEIDYRPLLTEGFVF